MHANELKHGKAYDCTMDGDISVEKTCIVPLAADDKTKQRFIIIEANKLQKENPDFFRKLIAMSFQEIVDEDIDGGPDRHSSSHILKCTLVEPGLLYWQDCDCYLNNFIEAEIIK